MKTYAEAASQTYNGSNQKPVEPISPIAQAFDSNLAHSELLIAELALLRDRLSPVLSVAEEPREKAGTNGVLQNGFHVGHCLGRQGIQLEAARGLIDEINARLLL